MVNEAPVAYRVVDGVAWITLNRPDRLNAMTHEMDGLIRDLVRRADDDEACVAICIKGAGKGFCSGADLGMSPQAGAPLPYETEPTTLEAFRFGYLRAARKPIIAAINGAAIGVGVVLAAFCDIRIAASNAKLGFTYSRVGLVAEYGAAWWLPRMIGDGASRDLLLSGRLIDATEACGIGLVDQVADVTSFDEHVAAYLDQLVQRCAPRALATIKEQLNAAAEQRLLEAVASSHRVLQAARVSADFAEGRAAFAEKRQPRFLRLAGKTGGQS